jgi:MYXO-CTERM domain-containing protein
VQAFGANGVTASICDGNYANAFSAIVSKIGAHLPGGSGSVSGSGTGGTSGSAAIPICPNGITHIPDGGLSGSTGGTGGNVCAPSSGLSKGGCDVGAARPSAWTLALLGALLAFAGRRRRASRR